MSNNDELIFTGERLVTKISNHYGTIEHLHRYAIALNFCKNKIVLDIASGEGYGTNLISSVASNVYGVDISEEAVIHAQNKYTHSNLIFKVGSTSKIPLDNNTVDVVVSFETIEHHEEHEEMMAEIKRVLKPDGTLIISSPEKEIYKERDPLNSFHIKELTGKEFNDLLSKHFGICKMYAQRYVTGSIITDKNEQSGKFEFYDGNFAKIENELKWEPFYNKPYFNFAICTDYEQHNANTHFVNASFFSGYNVYNEELNEHLKSIILLEKKIKKSKAYRIGFLIMTPFYLLKEIAKKISKITSTS